MGGQVISEVRAQREGSSHWSPCPGNLEFISPWGEVGKEGEWAGLWAENTTVPN